MTTGSQGSPYDSGDPGLRIDRWLWFTRLVKSRSLAAKLAVSGKIRIDGSRIQKASHMIRVGEVLTFPWGARIRVIKVVALGTRRGPAPDAQELYEDLSPPISKTEVPQTQLTSPYRAQGSGRPTKKDRRAIENLQRKTPDPQ